jgi:hypothetical protein
MGSAFWLSWIGGGHCHRVEPRGKHWRAWSGWPMHAVCRTVAQAMFRDAVFVRVPMHNNALVPRKVATWQ